MKAWGYVFSWVVLAVSCGQVKEKEVKLEMLPEGETNASYASSTTTEEEPPPADTTTDTATVDQLAKISQEMWARKDESCANNTPRVCSLTDNVAVTDAIVIAVRSCSTVTGSGCKASGVDSVAATTGPQFAFVEKLDGTASLLHLRGSNGGMAADVSVGSKVSFTARKFNQNFGTMRVYDVDPATVTVGTATAAEMFQLHDQIADIDSINYAAAIDTGHLYKLLTGYVKVNEVTTAMTGDAGKYWYTLNTKSYASGTRLWFRALSNLLTKNKCYELKNVSLTQSITPAATGVYLIDNGNYDTKTYGLSSFTEVDCATAGL